MSAEDSLRDGKLDEALSELQQQVRNNPADPKLRVFLFQLLAVLGQWDRALTQLGVSGEMDSSTLAMVQTYREAIRCEALRAEIFKGDRSPMIFGEPEQWVALLTQALQAAATGRFQEAASVRDEAFESAPATSGTLNGEPFEWICDADSRLGPVLETIINGHYYWIPLNRIHRINIEAPEDLRDMVWLPAYFTWSNGGETVGLIPTRYPGTEASADPALRLSRKTDWEEHEGDTYIGVGQRMLATDTGEYAMLEVRELVLDTAEETEDGAPAPDEGDG